MYLRREASVAIHAATFNLGAELDVLGTLIVAYEKEHYPIEALGPIEAIRYALDEAGLKDKDLIPFIGRRQTR